MRAPRTRPHAWRGASEWAILVSGTLLVVAAVWLQLSFANGPPQWEWPYRTSRLGCLWVVALAACLGLGLSLIDRWTAWLRLCLLTLLGLVLSLTVVASQPGGIERVIRSLVSRHVFSYVFDAGQFATLGETLAAYPERIEGLSMHTRTHPPGPLIGIQALDRLVPAADGTGGWVAVANDALREEVHKVGVRRRPVPHHLPSATTVVVLAFLLPAASALAALPLFLLAKGEGLGDRGALLAATLWLTVPARTLFTPSLDQAVPVLLLAATWLAGRQGRLLPLLAGVLGGAATVTSYGYLAATPLVLWPAVRGDTRIHASSALVRGVAVVVGLALPWLVLVALGFSPLRAFTTAMAEHRAMVGVGRSYLTWLVFNPWDLMLLTGVPVLLLAGLDLASALVSRARYGLAGAVLDTTPKRGQKAGSPLATAPAGTASGSRVTRPVTGDSAAQLSSGRVALAPVWWLVLATLLLSGTVRGEAGRIWLFLMPFAALFAGRVLERRSTAFAAVVLALQCLTLLSLAANLVFIS